MEGIRDDALQRVAEVLGRYEAIEAAYLFGSTAEGRARPDSDLDLALVGPADALQPRKIDLLADLTAQGFDRIDVVLLDEADPVLRFEAVHHNCLVYARSGFDHGSYFSRTVREYFDLEPYLATQRRAIKRRWLDGQA